MVEYATIHCKIFLPDLSDIQSALKTPGFTHVKRLITGHCSLMASLHRFNLAGSPDCICGNPTETVEHFELETTRCPPPWFRYTPFKLGAWNRPLQGAVGKFAAVAQRVVGGTVLGGCI